MAMLPLYKQGFLILAGVLRYKRRGMIEDLKRPEQQKRSLAPALYARL